MIAFSGTITGSTKESNKIPPTYQTPQRLSQSITTVGMPQVQFAAPSPNFVNPNGAPLAIALSPNVQFTPAYFSPPANGGPIKTSKQSKKKSSSRGSSSIKFGNVHDSDRAY